MILKVVFNKHRVSAGLGIAIALLVAAPAAAQEPSIEAPPDAAQAPSAPPSEPPAAAPSAADPSPTVPPAAVDSDPPVDGPVVELPAEVSPTEATAPERAIEDEDLVRGLRDYRFDQARSSGSVLGGYGELHYNLELPEGGESDAVLDLHRLVFFVAHQFSEAFRFYAELEIEHALVSRGTPGEIGVEQAFIDWKPWGEALQLRAGIVLVPMGVINEWHEPPIFHGVERPRVDRVIIPTTWREAGIGIFGEPTEGLRYQLYLIGGLDASGFSAGNGIRGGRQGIAEAAANGPAVTGRIEWEPTLGVVVGGSAYYGVAGPNAGELNRLVARDAVTGEPILGSLELAVPVFGLEADARVRMRGFEARAVFATFSVGDTAALREAVDESTGDPLGYDVGARSIGAYAEVAYDVLRLMTRTDQQLLPFVRFEYWDTAAALSGRARTPADDARRVTDLVVGLSYRPITQVVVKADFIYRNPAGTGTANRLVDVGVGWMF